MPFYRRTSCLTVIRNNNNVLLFNKVKVNYYYPVKLCKYHLNYMYYSVIKIRLYSTRLSKVIVLLFSKINKKVQFYYRKINVGMIFILPFFPLSNKIT